MNEKALIAKMLTQCPGWASLEHVLTVMELIRKFRLEYIVEVGVFGGRTLLPMAWACKGHSGLVVGVDTFFKDNKTQLSDDYRHLDFETLHSQFVQKVDNYGLKGHVRLIRKDPEHVAKKLPTEIELLKLDGNRGAFASFHEARLYVKKVRKGGFYWFENMDKVEVSVVLRESKVKTVEVVRFDSHHAILERV